MPRIKRWFPVNHNINRDPEVWVMRREIGEKSLSIWLEFLSLADQNEGEIPGDYEALVRSVSGTCQATTRTVRAVYQYAITKVWLKSEPTLHVVKYWNYHKAREPQKTPLGPLPSEPSEPILPNKKSKKTSFPIDFVIGPQLRGWCLQQHVFDPEPHFEAFKDFHIAKGSRFTDWDAAFRTWIRNRERFGPTKIVTKSAADQLRLRTAETLKRGL